MAVAHVQDDGVSSGASTSQALAFSSDVTAGSLLIAVVNVYSDSDDSTDFSISDNQGNTWTNLFLGDYNSNDMWAFYYAENAAAGATTVTVTMASSNYYSLGIAEASGTETSTSLDQSSTGTANDSAPTSGDITSTIAGIWYGVVVHDGSNTTITPDAAFTELYEVQNPAVDMPINFMYKVGTIETDAASWTFAGDQVWEAGVGAWKEVAVAGGTAVKDMIGGMGIIAYAR